MRRHLILVSESYPYSGASETTFIDPEIEYLVGGFADVILVPERIYGKGNVPGGVILEKSLAAALARNRVVMVLRGALTWEFLSEILDFPAVCTSWNALLRTAMFIARARVASAWIEKFLARRTLNPEETVVYCFLVLPLRARLRLVQEEGARASCGRACTRSRSLRGTASPSLYSVPKEFIAAHRCGLSRLRSRPCLSGEKVAGRCF